MENKVQLALDMLTISEKDELLDANQNSKSRIKVVATPFSSNIEAGKNTYVYDAHTYHTKVPPEGIKEVIKFYTNPGNTVLDPFCGSGMTGVAALEIGRKAILSDLSPAAVFIASNITTPIDPDKYISTVNKIINHFKEEELELYGTICRKCSNKVPINYTVWSYNVICYHCNKQFNLWDAARSEKPNVKESKILSEFACPCCSIVVKKKKLKRSNIIPVIIGYRCKTNKCSTGNKDINVAPDENDKQLLNKIASEGIPKDIWYPTDTFPDGVNTKQPIQAGIISIDKAYTPRALRVMAKLWDYANKIEDAQIRQKILFTITSLYQRVTVFSEFRFWGGSGNIANYSVPSIMNEQNVFATFLRKAKTIEAYFRTAPKVNRSVETRIQSACNLDYLDSNSIDYIFTDPPFGSNINYSEMNFLWESWLQLKTDTKEEAIVNKVQNKQIADYQILLKNAFIECKRVLKPGCWLTVVFHNSSDKVWVSLQNALKEAGLIIRSAHTFDKKHGTFKQFVSQNAVGYDIMVHCQKELKQTAINMEYENVSSKSSIMTFITTEIANNKDSYLVKYLHVTRKDEFDYRKLYAKWLTESISNSAINFGFDEFRSIVDKVIHPENIV